VAGSQKIEGGENDEKVDHGYSQLMPPRLRLDALDSYSVVVVVVVFGWVFVVLLLVFVSLVMPPPLRRLLDRLDFYSVVVVFVISSVVVLLLVFVFLLPLRRYRHPHVFFFWPHLLMSDCQ
jgi:hypothetical protein